MSKQLLIRVITTNLVTGDSNGKVIDHNNREQRQWLGKHSFWAVRNNHSVMTTPVSNKLIEPPPGSPNAHRDNLTQSESGKARMKAKRPLLSRVLGNSGWLLGVQFAAPLRPKHWGWKTELAACLVVFAVLSLLIVIYIY